MGKQKTIERDKTTTDYENDYTGTSEEESVSEGVSEKVKSSDITKNTVALSVATLIMGIALPFGGWILAIFATTTISSFIGFGDTVSGALSGATVALITGFLGGIIVSVLSLGFALLPTIVAGLIAGGVGGFIGDNVRS